MHNTPLFAIGILHPTQITAYFLINNNLIAAYNFSISSGDSPVTSAIKSTELPFIFSL